MMLPITLLATVARHDVAMSTGNGAPVSLAAVPFALSDVTLDSSGLFGIVQARNIENVLSINASNLLCQHTSAANLTKCHGSNCPMPGGEGSPICEPLPGEMSTGAYFGHYLGHWLSATAFLINGTGSDAVRSQATAVVHALELTMGAWKAKYGAEHDGYLFPLDPIVFHYLHTDSAGCDRHLCGLYSVPYYTWHKTMAGLLDLYTHAADQKAYQLVLRMASWVRIHAEATVHAPGGQDLWQRVLNTEWGGMNEVLFHLYALTKDPAHLATGRLFNHWTWSAPLAAGVDDLGGNHANTHIPEVLGNAVGYELTANATDRAIALEFFAAVTANHSWATGGSNDGEYWGAPKRLGDALNANTEESCTQYNILKVARHLYSWTANASLADFYEKAMLNGIVGNQRRDEPSGTSFIYMLPLGGTGMGKPWGASSSSFPCCWGTLTEQLSKLGDSIYFRSPPEAPGARVALSNDPTRHLGVRRMPSLFVNLFVASTLSFAAAGVTVVQATTFPTDPKTTTTLKIGALDGVAPTRFALHLRVPAWATGLNVVLLNGQPLNGTCATPGSYLRIERAWAVGDSLVASFPMRLSLEPLNDERDAFNATAAYMYGPLVLAGVTASRWFVPEGNASEPASYIRRNSTTALEFEGRGRLYTPAHDGAHDGAALDGARLAGTSLRLVPLYQIVEERYTVYFDSELKTVPYAAGGATVPSSSMADFATSGGAGGSGGPRDALCSGENVRSGDPGGVGRITLDHPLLAPGFVVDAVSLSFRYVAGYTPAPGENKTAPTVKVLLSGSDGATLAILFDSSELGNYSFDHFTSYSPPIVASATGLGVSNEDLVFISLEVTNNARNLQMPVDDLAAGFNCTVSWKQAADDQHHAHAHSHGGGAHAHEHDHTRFAHGRGVWW